MGESTNPSIFQRRPYGKGKTPALIVVGVAVPGVYGYIKEVRSFNKSRVFQFKSDPAPGSQFRQQDLVDLRVGPVTAGPAAVEHPDPEDDISGGAVNLVVQLNQDIFPVLKDMPFPPLII